MKFINFDEIVNKNNENYINKNVFRSSTCFKYNYYWTNKCSKTNLLFNILTLHKIVFKKNSTRCKNYLSE